MNEQDTPVSRSTASPGTKANRGLLGLGGIGAALASICCILPLVLVMLGLGGAWLSNLHALYSYRWLFIGAAAVALFFAWRRLYRQQPQCAANEVCATPKVTSTYRILLWSIAGLVVLSAVSPYLLSAILS
ncbi:MAG: mercuric transport protein [Idiomarina sp.]|nr:mercuric transport protein [Idiomarina sp.]